MGILGTANAAAHSPLKGFCDSVGRVLSGLQEGARRVNGGGGGGRA